MEFIAQFHFFLLLGPALLSVAFVIWYRLLRSLGKRSAVPPSDGLRLLGISLICFLVGSVGSFAVVQATLNAYTWGLVEPESVDALRIERLAPPFESIVLTDRNVIRAGLEALSTSRSRGISHESFSDGFRIQLRLAGEDEFSEIYLTAYRFSTRVGDTEVVIPHIGREYSGVLHNAGVYACPEFHRWLINEVEPLFTKETL